VRHRELARPRPTILEVDMAFLLKIQWDIKPGHEAVFRDNQAALCEVMLDHPGVVCYHACYPSERVSLWTEVYATDEAFVDHLADERGKQPLAAVIDACERITCQCWGTPDAASREILAGFDATYHETAENAFVLNPRADRTVVM
jgi:quinol monooxygenase YgiN